MPNLSKMLKQAQRLKSEMAKAQKEIAVMERSFSTGGGVVTATARGDNTITALRIEPALLAEQDVETLQEMVLLAVNGALEAVQTASEERFSDATAGLDLPSGFMP
jgi:DNA-binding YbaB/EbfC family protein